MTATQGIGIGEAASATGLTEDTLRYYEREGLVGPIDRDASGPRRNGDNDVSRIGVVTCLRDAGLGIADLRRFTRLLRSPTLQSADGEAGERVEFLTGRRDELVRQAGALAAVLKCWTTRSRTAGVTKGSGLCARCRSNIRPMLGLGFAAMSPWARVSHDGDGARARVNIRGVTTRPTSPPRTEDEHCTCFKNQTATE